MGIITKEWMDTHDVSIQNVLQPLSDAQIVRTLSTIPTESTLSYLIGAVEHDYKIGDEVRVEDNDSELGYIYYKLYDIEVEGNNRTAIWDKLGSGSGDSVLMATIKVTLQAIVNSNVTLGSDLNNVVVSVQNITDNTAAVTKQWQGSELVFSNLIPAKVYTISVAAVSGYTTPSSYTTSALSLRETVSRTFQYEADEYTFSISGHQNGAVTYNNVSYSNGNTVKVPAGTTVSASDFTAAEIEDYRATLTLSGKAITCVYEEFTGYVDLGLPSGKLWATGNLVKDSEGNYSIGEETDWGTYISWGNIIGHNEGEGYNFDQTTYDSTPGKQVAANIPSNDAAHDIALATLGTPWHLPTKEDYQELYDNTDSEWVADYNGTGVAGRKFMKKSDHSVYVFFPASGFYNGTSLNYRGTNGYYWSSSFYSATHAYLLYFNSSSVNPQNDNNRRLGFTVRPVQLSHKNITITLNPTDESSVDNIQVTVTDSEGFSHSGTTDSNGVATISNVGIGSCTVKAQGKGLSPKIITVTTITSFTLDCYDQVKISGYMIDQSDTTASSADYIKDVDGNTFNGSRNSDDADDVIHRIWSNTKLYAADTSLSGGKLQVRELNRSNKSQWTDGTTVVNNTTYDKFMKLPEFWWHCEEVVANTDRWKIEFTMDNPNDESWNHWDGNTFIGVYEAYYSNGLVYSRYNQTPTGSVSWTNFKSYAVARGTGYSLVTYEAHMIMALLGYGWLGTTNDQSVVGYGGNEYNKATGKCDAKGIHDTSAAVDGGNTAGGGSNISINFWGLENWYGNISEWVDNIRTANTSGLVDILIPGSSTRNRTIQTTTSTGGCITKTTMGDNGDMIPKAYVSDTTYSKGYASFGAVTGYSNYVAFRSGNNAYATNGLVCLNIGRSVSDPVATIGSRLQYQGAWEENNTLT